MADFLPAPGRARGARMSDLNVEANAALVDGLYRLADRYQRRSTICRWIRRPARAYVLAQAETQARLLADGCRGVELPSVQPAATADAWVALGYELGVGEAVIDSFLDGYSAARADAAVLDGAAADTVPAFLSDRPPAAPTTPAGAPQPGPADTREVSI